MHKHRRQVLPRVVTGVGGANIRKSDRDTTSFKAVFANLVLSARMSRSIAAGAKPLQACAEDDGPSRLHSSPRQIEEADSVAGLTQRTHPVCL